MKKVLILFIILIVSLSFSACNKKTSVTVYTNYYAYGKLVISDEKWTNEYQFEETKYNDTILLKIKRDNVLLEIKKQADKVIINNKEINMVNNQVFMDYYINLLFNSEKINQCTQNGQFYITLDDKKVIYYFDKGKLSQIEVVSLYSKFRKKIILKKYIYYERDDLD